LSPFERVPHAGTIFTLWEEPSMEFRMKRWLLGMFCLLLAGCAHLSRPQRGALCPDGIYQSGKVSDEYDSYWYYLRFYPDGTVISVSSTGQPDDLRSWFNLEMDDLSAGHVVLQGDHLSFSQTSKEGTVDYAGTVAGSTLHLDSHSRINDFRDRHVFTCVAWKPALRPAATAGSGRP
jgi:hypothetical protein